MAGTRLVIQATFVVEFLVLALSAVYFGLYKTKDPLSFHLPHYQRGRSVLQGSLRRLDDDTPSTLPLAPLQFVTTSGILISLQQQHEDSTQQWRFMADEQGDASVMEFCRAVAASVNDNILPLEEKDGSMYLCPPDNAVKGPAVVVRNGVTVLYPDSADTDYPVVLHRVLGSFPQSGKGNTRRKPLKLTLMIEHRRDWSDWANAFSSWLQTNQESLNAWPCLQHKLETQVALSTLVEDKASSKGTSNDTIRMISTIDMKQSVLDPRSSSADDFWNVILFVPRVTPSAFVCDTQQNAKEHPKCNAMFVDTTMVTTIGQPELVTVDDTRTITTTTKDDEGSEISNTVEETTQTEVQVPLETLVADAMAPLGEFLLQQCLGVDPQLFATFNGVNDDKMAFIDYHSDGSLPLWLMEAWLQRSLVETYQQIRTETRNEGEWLLESSTWVIIDEQVAAHWQTLMEWIQEVANNSNKSSSYLNALTILEDALEYLQVLRSEPTLMEPLRFSAPQFLAIFAPLCLPLFLPHVVGLIREWKRYKTLSSSSSSS